MDITIDKIKEIFITKLQKSGWDIPLRSFIYSTEFEKIINFLYKESKEGRKITPALRYIFRAFELCPYNELKVVIVNLEPYSREGVADGLAFSQGFVKKPEELNKLILEEVNRTVYNSMSISLEPDLNRWAEQGILLLNTALTTTLNKSAQHYLVWKPFLAYLFDFLTWNHPGLIYIYMGKKVSEWSIAVNDNNYKFMIEHPLSAHYDQRGWNSQDVFNKVSEIVQNNYNYKIIW
jgi:uracil-DNA glycosylase